MRQNSEHSPLHSESAATETTEKSDVTATPTESADEQFKNGQSTHQSKDDSSANQPSNDEPVHTKEEVPASDAATVDSDNGTSKTVYIFSTENIPDGCYYLTQSNKYVFPGSTHTWYGSGNPDVDREGIFEEEEEDDDEFEIGFDEEENDGDDDDDDDDDNDDDDDGEDEDEEDDVEDCDEDKCEAESLTNHGENSDSNGAVVDANSKPSDSMLVRKRIGIPDNDESVSPVKQSKPNDE